MENQFYKLKELTEEAKNILVTAHISPDPDAIASVLLAGTTLKANYPEKQIHMVMEEKPEGLEFLTGFEHLEFSPVAEAIEQISPDVIIMLDANNWDRISRHNGQKIREDISEKSVKTIIIDHHEPNNKDQSYVYIHQNSPATVQDVYEVFFNQLGLKKPESYAQTTLTGLYADTGGFVHTNPRYADTFRLVADLISAGASIEKVKNQLNVYTEDHMKVFAHLALNLTHEDDYTYTFVSDNFFKEWQSNKDPKSVYVACSFFTNEYLRNIDGRKWGFLVYPFPPQGENYYSVSFRAVAESKDVAQIAGNLGGGGHKPAAGAKFQAANIEEAIDIVKAAIVK